MIQGYDVLYLTTEKRGNGICVRIPKGYGLKTKVVVVVLDEPKARTDPATLDKQFPVPSPGMPKETAKKRGKKK